MPSFKQDSGSPVNGLNEQGIVTSISSVPATVERKPFIQAEYNQSLPSAGTPRANIAASFEQPNGTTEKAWAKEHQHQTVIQQHVEFFDRDLDGIIWPQDTFIGFYRLGYGFFVSLLSLFIIHINFSYATSSSWIPDPFFRIYTANIHKAKHGSDSGTYDNEGRFVPQKFEDIFSKYAEEKDGMTIWDVARLWKGQRLVSDPIGWGGAVFEWVVTYILLWPEDGKMKKEDIRRVYDGSIFYDIAEKREKEKARKSMS